MIIFELKTNKGEKETKISYFSLLMPETYCFVPAGKVDDPRVTAVEE